MSDRPNAEIERIRRERDLYLRLLELGGRTDLEPFLRDALALVVELTEARQGYLELRDETAESESEDWWIAHDCSSEEIADIRAATSRGIIAEALATGETVATPSARMDPRFRDRGSVQAARIEAVLCIPIGGSEALGALYLQGGSEAGAFSQDDRSSAENFARYLAPLADRLLVRHRMRESGDATREWREKLRLASVVGRSAAFADTLRQVALVAPLEVSVLLTGASGTGKSQLARVIHDNGPRAAKPFVEVNCGALPETLIESELFGALAGAHSTAHRDLPGKVGAAEGGTLLLDEVGELPPSAQSKLLQLLQSHEYFPLGSSKAMHADVRVLAATNVDLEEAVREKRFREDLFYRLQVLPIRVPSLSERRDDIPELSAFFATSACERHSLPRIPLSAGAELAIAGAEWPGNIRQLAHAIEAAAIRAAGDGHAQIERKDLFPGSADEDGTVAETFQEATRGFQRELLRRTLDETGWNMSESARRLDLARSHVYNLVRAFGLSRHD